MLVCNVCRIFLLALFTLAFNIPVEKLTDLERHRLIGRVKSVMEIKYTLTEKKANAPKDKIVYQKFTKYDENGYMIENIIFVANVEYLISRFTMGADGKPSGWNETTADGTRNLAVNYQVNEKGIIAEAIYEWEDDYKLGAICEYADYYNELIQNELFTKIIYTTEYRGYITGENFIKADGSTSFSLSSKYDPNGNRLELSYFKGDGHLSWISKYKYDRYNNLLESRLFKSNRIAVQSMYKHQFDETGNWVMRREERQVYVNILTAGLERADMVTERTIEYY
jgi:hypothetical protein